MTQLEQDAENLAKAYLKEGQGIANELFHLMTINKNPQEITALRQEFQKQIKIIKSSKK